MKRIGELFVFVLGILQLPTTIQFISKRFYGANEDAIWITTVLLVFIFAITQLNLKGSPRTRKIFRSIRFYIFKTPVIVSILLLQLVVALIYMWSAEVVDTANVLVAFGINLIGINTLIILGKIPNSDSKDLIFHTPDGHMHLYSNNVVRFVPDPETFNLLGLSWGDPIDITHEELGSYPLSVPVTSIKEMQLFNYKNKIYGLVNEELKHIPNEKTLGFICSYNSNSIKNLKSINEYKVASKPFVTYSW